MFQFFRRKSFLIIATLVIIGILISLLIFRVNHYKSVQTIKRGDFKISFEKNELGILNRTKLKTIITYEGKEKTIVYYGEKNMYITEIMDNNGEPISLQKNKEVHTGVGIGKYLTKGDSFVFYSDRVTLDSGKYNIHGYIEFDTKSKQYKIPFNILVHL